MSEERVATLQRSIREAIERQDSMRAAELIRDLARERSAVRVRGIEVPVSAPPPQRRAPDRSVVVSSHALTKVVAIAKGASESLFAGEAALRTLGEKCGERPWADLLEAPTYKKARDDLRKAFEKCSEEVSKLTPLDVISCLDEIPSLLASYKGRQAEVAGALRERCDQRPSSPNRPVSNHELQARGLAQRNSHATVGSMARSTGVMLSWVVDVAATGASVTLGAALIGLQIGDGILRGVNKVAGLLLEAPPQTPLLEAPPETLLLEAPPATPQQTILAAPVALIRGIVDFAIVAIVRGPNRSIESFQAGTAFGMAVAGQPVVRALAGSDANNDDSVSDLIAGLRDLSVSASDNDGVRITDLDDTTLGEHVAKTQESIADHDET